MQLADVAAPVVGKYEPALHFEQADEPELGVNVPAMQLLHDDIRAAGEYVPAAHSGQVLASVNEYVPTAQLEQLAGSEAPDKGRYVPDEHEVQLNEPVEGWYLPGEHGTHELDPLPS